MYRHENTYLHLPRGAEWMLWGAEKQHPTKGLKTAPKVEDAGTRIFILCVNHSVFLVPTKKSKPTERQKIAHI